MVPHLTTALTGPLFDLERRFLDNSADIERWLRGEWQAHTPPFYASVDLRNAAFKLAPVDTNLFPGGFNNLNPAFLPLCVHATMSAIERICPDARSLLLIPENHTRNQYYLQNVAALVTILRQTGLNVRVGSMSPEITKPTELALASGQNLLLEPLKRVGHRLGVDGFDPCAILLNNDLSAGIPGLLKQLDGQTVLPPLHAGWAVRRKSYHFHAYDDVAQAFARVAGIDPWRINPIFTVCSAVDFHGRQGEECLAANVDAVLKSVAEKYAEYGIDEKPYVVVKADAGTYGMGVMTVKDASEVIALNRKQRNKMAVVKEGLEVSQVIIQEGVHSIERAGPGDAGGVAEPVVYMIDRFVVGGFYRVHAGRGRDENLNAPGMHFEPLAFECGCQLPCFEMARMHRRTAFTPTASLPGWHCSLRRSNSNARRRRLPRLRQSRPSPDPAGSGGLLLVTSYPRAGRRFVVFLASCGAALATVLAAGCGRPAVHQQESFVFGTQVQVTVAGVDEAAAHAAAGAVLAEFDRLHRLLHAWQPSAITELNAALAAGRPHRPQAEVLALLVDAKAIAAASDHLFDPGIGGLVRLWGFQTDEFIPKLPEAQALAAWRRAPGSIADLSIAGDMLGSGNRAVAIDLGGYAKGVALDRAASILRGRGVTDALINIGGNVMALGSKNGVPWKVGIRDPAGSGYLATLELRDGEAIGTSGDYQRYFEIDGRRYSHLLDPRTGEPAQGTRALTILVDGKDAGMRSDALSKPLFIAGQEGWRAMADRLDVARVLRVDASGELAVTGEMAQRLVWPAGARVPGVADGRP